MSDQVFRAGFLFSGLGAGARGFVVNNIVKQGAHTARFINVGGVDIDAAAARDFERFSHGKALVADLSQPIHAEIRALMGERRPDVIFTSPPCKGFSGLLPKHAAEKEKYQQLNKLVLQGLFLICETWSEPPPLIVLENVPRIKSRGAELLRQVRQLLRHYGYTFHEGTHDCGVIGGLAQHRDRFMLVARRSSVVPQFLYKPAPQRVKACGEVLGPLPLPNDPGAGPLHVLPEISDVNWVRLALIPAGGDWRDLPRAGQAELGHEPRRGSYEVTGWDAAAKTVRGVAKAQNGGAAVADPRVEQLSLTDRPNRHRNKYAVTDFDAPAPAVIGSTRPGSGAPSVADPRVAEIGINGWPGKHNSKYGISPWSEPIGTITGDTDIQAGAKSVADPRLAELVSAGATGENADSFKGRPGYMGVGSWDGPAPTVTGKMSISGGNGTAAIADPRLVSPLQPGQPRREVFKRHEVADWNAPTGTIAGGGTNGVENVADPRPFGHVNRVTPWQQPVGTITHSPAPSSGGAAAADPRVAALRCEPYSGAYGVNGWDEPADTVTGSAQIDNGRVAVADPRIPTGYIILSLDEALRKLAAKEPLVPKGKIPVIIAADGTWHRPLTTLELAVLQGLPAVLEDGAPLTLTATRKDLQREHIGNAVPVGAARAIAGEMLKALLAAALGTFSLSGSGQIWVRPRARSVRRAPRLELDA